MGVQGLWKILSPTSRPVSLESLENKVLAVDVSVWLHQSVKGMRDSHGRPLANAHLIGLFNRICKLLFYNIKPIFVFDGSVPALKKQTIIRRRQQKADAYKEAKKISEKILGNYVKSQVLGKALGNERKTVVSHPLSSRQPDMYDLPPLPEENLSQEMNDNEDDNENSCSSDFESNEINVAEVDIDSEEFLTLPTEAQHDILLELRESSKRHSWTQLDSLPLDANDFSNFQLQGLLQRNKVQQRIDAVQKQLCSEASRNMLAALEEQDYHLDMETQRIISEDLSHYVLLKEKDSSQNKSLSQDHLDRSPSKEVLRDTNITGDTNTTDQTHIMLQDSLDSQDDALTTDTDEIIIQKIIQKPPRKSVIISPKNERDISVFEPSTSLELFEKRNEDENVELQKILLESYETVKQSNIDCSTKYLVTDNIFSKTNQNPFALDSVTCIDEDKLYQDKSVSVDKEENINIFVEENEINKLNKVSQRLNSIEHDDFFPGEKNIEELNYFNDSKSKIENVANCETTMNTTEYSITSKMDCISNFSVNKETKNMVEIKEEEKILNEEKSEASQKQSVVMDVTCKSENVQAKEFESPKYTKKSELFLEEKSDKDEESEDEFIDISDREEPESPDSRVATAFVGEQHKEPSRNMQKEFEGIRTESLANMEEEILMETHNLHKEYGRQERMAASITEQMNLESQELLRLFGIPFLISPTEAEAQCAYLDETDQVHGTITDDSDIWLFGGKRVYKNFFNQKRQVEFFTLTNIKSHLGLDRDKMINIALLTGSDYTEGVEGVGTVTAMEILSEFLGNGIVCLQKFRTWWDETRKQSKIPHETKIRAKLRQLDLTDSFPNPVVIDGYLKPDVNMSTEPFSWGIPDLDAIRDFAKNRFGWNKTKTDEILLPILKKMNERKNQTRIDSFFTMKLKKDNEVTTSKRVARAVKVILKDVSPTHPKEKFCKKLKKSGWVSTLNLSESSSSESSNEEYIERKSSQISRNKHNCKRTFSKIETSTAKKRAVLKK